jgi:hypothetical protein
MVKSRYRIKILVIFLLTIFCVGMLVFSTQKTNYELPLDLYSGSVKVLKEVRIREGSVEQGILDFENYEGRQLYFSSNHAYISKFDKQWKLIKSNKPLIEGITKPHIGILAKDQEAIWGGVIDLEDYPFISDTRIIKIDPKSLDILQTVNFSSISKYVDAFDVEGNEFWVAYKDFVKVYVLLGNEFKLERSYRVLTGTPQGLRLSEKYMCIVGESITMMLRGFENGIYCYERNNLNAFESSFLADLIVNIDKFLASINYRVNNKLINVYFSKQVNSPQKHWSYGFPIDNVDNEGFAFSSADNGIIWASDETGDTARQLQLVGF